MTGRTLLPPRSSVMNGGTARPSFSRVVRVGIGSVHAAYPTSRHVPPAGTTAGRANFFEPRFDAGQRLVGEGLGAVSDPLTGKGDQSIATAAGSTSGSTHLNSGTTCVRAAGTRTAAGSGPCLGPGSLKTCMAFTQASQPGHQARWAQPLVPVRGPAERPVPVRHVEPVTGLRGAVQGGRVRRACCSSRSRGRHSPSLRISFNPPVPLVPRANVDDVLNDAGLYQSAAVLDAAQVERHLLHQRTGPLNLLRRCVGLAEQVILHRRGRSPASSRGHCSTAGIPAMPRRCRSQATAPQAPSRMSPR
jgi:hypothetical protein